MKMMRKRRLVTAVAATMAVGASFAVQAGVEVYGKARMSLDFINNDDSTAGNEDSAVSLSSNTSRLGFKGDEDLGNGLSALWQLETQVDFDTGSAFQSARNTFIGLGGGFGTVLAGRYETPLRIVTARFDPFSDTKGDYNAIIGNIRGNRLFDNRTPNIVSYASPDMAGLKLHAAYSFNRTSDDLPMTTTESERELASVGAGYENGPLYLAASYETIGNLTANDDGVAYRVGAAWNFGQGTVLSGLFENADRGGANGERSALYASATHKMGDNSLKAAIAMADDVDGIGSSGATQITLGGFHSFTKNTEVYALYTQVDNDSNGTYGLWSGSQAVAGFADKSVSAISVGINHNFSSK